MADLADIAGGIEELERQWALVRARRRVRQCTACGDDIARDRLDALPETDLCGGCAARAAEGLA